jgi:septum formation protein
LWLASGSPRRRTLLEWAGFEVEVHPPAVDESRHSGEDPVVYAQRLATSKVATAPAGRLALAADTIVHRDQHLFDKPSHRTEAAATLRALSDGWHLVSTAVAMAGPRNITLVATTRVRFRALSDSEIHAYLATGEADDKAGAYGIQGRAAVFVAEVQGSWTNVVGLPVELVVPALHELTAR